MELRQVYENDLLQRYYANYPLHIKNKYSYSNFYLEYRACLARSMMSSVMMIGKRFSHKKNQLDMSDIIANRVINAVKQLRPVDAMIELLQNH